MIVYDYAILESGIFWMQLRHTNKVYNFFTTISEYLEDVSAGCMWEIHGEKAILETIERICHYGK